MALETGNYIDSLNASNPAATDALAQADDHLRLLKLVLKQSFPAIAGPVTATHTVINAKIAEPVSAITSDGTDPSLATGITGTQVKTLIGAADAAIATDGTDPSLATGITALQVRTLIGAAEAATTATLLAVYPVGSIYTSVVATSPATHFGGTWAAMAAGRVLVGLDPDDVDFDTIEGTGGAKTHQLTISEMPAHSHSVTYEEVDNVGQTTHPAGTIPGEPSLAIDTGSTGGGQAHTIVQPFLTVYMWKRTA
jgi:hypothetical protein